jgi:acyl carrier protein
MVGHASQQDIHNRTERDVMQDYQRILTLTTQSLKPFAPEGAEITERTELANELDLDSVQVMEMSFTLEEQFDISIPVNALSEVVTVRDLALAIQKLTQDA